MCLSVVGGRCGVPNLRSAVYPPLVPRPSGFSSLFSRSLCDAFLRELEPQGSKQLQGARASDDAGDRWRGRERESLRVVARRCVEVERNVSSRSQANVGVAEDELRPRRTEPGVMACWCLLVVPREHSNPVSRPRSHHGRPRLMASEACAKHVCKKRWVLSV